MRHSITNVVKSPITLVLVAGILVLVGLGRLEGDIVGRLVDMLIGGGVGASLLGAVRK